MVEKSRVLELLYGLLDEVNESRAADVRLPKSPTTALLGTDSVLDSLGLVHVVVGFEQKIAEELGSYVTLADEKAMSQRNSPFRTVDTLVDYALELINT